MANTKLLFGKNKKIKLQNKIIYMIYKHVRKGITIEIIVDMYNKKQ